MRVLFTHPGKLGDVLWSLATVRALVGRLRITDEVEVTFATSEHCRGLLPVLEAQPYIDHAVVLTDWVITGDCPGLQPATPPMDESRFRNFSLVHHLGLTEWPQPTLVEDYARRVGVLLTDRRWLAHAPSRVSDLLPRPLVIFTDEWAELKAGLVNALDHDGIWVDVVGAPRSRITREWAWDVKHEVSLTELYRMISLAPLVITDKSAARVMAYGLNVPTVVVEPSPPRHNPVFDPPPPWRQEAALINGFDAREVVAAVKSALEVKHEG